MCQRKERAIPGASVSYFPNIIPFSFRNRTHKRPDGDAAKPTIAQTIGFMTQTGRKSLQQRPKTNENQ